MYCKIQCEYNTYVVLVYNGNDFSKEIQKKSITFRLDPPRIIALVRNVTCIIVEHIEMFIVL